MKKIIILIMWLIPLQADYAPNIRIDENLSQFILSVARRYDVTIPLAFYCQPMKAVELHGLFNSLDSLENSGILSKEEQNRLWLIKRRINGIRNIFSFRHDKIKTENFLSLGLWGDVNLWHQNFGDINLKGIINPKFSGSVGKVSYFTEIDVWTEFKTDTSFYGSDYQPFNGNPYNLYGREKKSNVRSSDKFRGGISYDGKRIDIETAIDYYRVGPAVFYPLTFSGKGMPLTYCRINMDLKRFRYTHTFGLLKTQKNKSKYFYTHRFDIPLLHNYLHFGINEVIINGSTAEHAQTDSIAPRYYGDERTLEWAYMIPFIPYSFAEHYVGDRDNAILSADISVLFPKHFRWYADVFLDDITSPATIFSDDFGNKWGLTAGAQYFGFVANRPLDITIEYSRIRPWVYTHFCGGSHRFTHFGESLGSSNGPDSDAFRIQGEHNVSKRHRVGIFLENLRKGHGRGSDVNHVFQLESHNLTNPDLTEVGFFENGYSCLTTVGLLWKLNKFGIFSMDTELTYNFDNKIGIFISGGFLF